MYKLLSLLILIPHLCMADGVSNPAPIRLDFYSTTKFISDMKLSQGSEKSALMFGDSIVQSLNGNDMHFDYVNLGIGGDTAAGVLSRMKDVNLGAYKSVFVSVGTNNLFVGQRGAQLGEAISEIITYAAPRSKELFVSEVFVPNSTINKQIPDDFPEADTAIHHACSKFKNCRVIPLPKKFIGDNGLSLDMSLEDGVHLNSTAYKLWKVEINKVMADFPVNYYYRARY